MRKLLTLFLILTFSFSLSGCYVVSGTLQAMNPRIDEEILQNRKDVRKVYKNAQPGTTHISTVKSQIEYKVRKVRSGGHDVYKVEYGGYPSQSALSLYYFTTNSDGTIISKSRN